MTSNGDVNAEVVNREFIELCEWPVVFAWGGRGERGTLNGSGCAAWRVDGRDFYFLDGSNIPFLGLKFDEWIF